MFYRLDLDQERADLFEKYGINMEQLLKFSGIPPRALMTGKVQITEDQFKEMVQFVDRQMDDGLILELAKVDSVASFNPEFFAGLCAENGLECIKRIAKYKRILAPIRMVITEKNNQVSISYAYTDHSPVPRMMSIFAQISILSIIRKGTGIETLRPLQVFGPSAYSEPVKAFLGIEPTISQAATEIVFSTSDLERPFITKNNKMWDYLESELNQRLREVDTDASFSAAVRKSLVELLPSGYSDASRISKELGVSKRTLQRRLKDENTSFNAQLNHTRELMVRNYLKMGMNLDEIAFLVNYSDAKSLSRAFKTWTGSSIKHYRKGL